MAEVEDSHVLIPRRGVILAVSKSYFAAIVQVQFSDTWLAAHIRYIRIANINACDACKAIPETWCFDYPEILFLFFKSIGV